MFVCLKKETASIRSCSSVLHKPVKFHERTPASQQTHMHTSHYSPADSCDQTIMCVCATSFILLTNPHKDPLQTHTRLIWVKWIVLIPQDTYISYAFCLFGVLVADIMLMNEWASGGVVLQWFYHTEVKAVAAFCSLFVHPRFIASHSFSILACKDEGIEAEKILVK